jgi:hypothetical protein
MKVLPPFVLEPSALDHLLKRRPARVLNIYGRCLIPALNMDLRRFWVWGYYYVGELQQVPIAPARRKAKQ